MKPENINRLFRKMHVPAGPDLDERIHTDLTRLLVQSKPLSAPTRPNIWRLIMKSKITKFSFAAIMILAAALTVYVFDRSIPSAYAIEQTREAFANIRFVHVIRHDAASEIEDERWIEIGPDGSQVRYRQDTKGKILIVNDGKNGFVYREDKNTVLLYGPDGPQYQWISNLHNFFKDMAGDSTVTIRENVEYKGHKAHLVRWLKLNIDCYIDPLTKLPLALGRDEIYYDEPAEDIFKMPEIPKTAILVDKRPGAVGTKDPNWLQEENDSQAILRNARESLASGRYTESIELFKKLVMLQSKDNWSWFWMGQAYYKLGENNAAVEAYTKVIDMFAAFNLKVHYAHLARGLAYRATGKDEQAWKDFSIALPVMIDSLRNIQSASMFDYADDPRGKGKKLTDEERFKKMVARLTEVAGVNLGYDPLKINESDKDKVITSWQQWWKETAAKHNNVQP